MALLDEHIEGKYEILGKLREGGMGAIYKVRHRLLDEVRVVKVIRAHESSEEAAGRFLSEAKAAIRLRHPNVAVLHDFAVTGDGQAFIVMEYIDGWNLLEVLNGYGPPPIALTLEIARQSLKALGYLHRHRIVHRDVSPDNLMLTRDIDGNPQVKLIDLGIAKTLEGQGGLTSTGIFLGKPRYGSPERFSSGSWDARSDLYSFGVVLYELLTGHSPITGGDPTSLMAGHLFRPPLDFGETDPEGRVPAELRRVVLKALEKKPDDRMASAEDFLWELTLLQDLFHLTHEELDGVWKVLLPLPHAAGPTAEPPGSTQSRLDLQFGAARTPAAGLATGEAALAATRELPQGKVVPFSPPAPQVPPAMDREATRRSLLSPEDLDATWATRPLRKGKAPAADPSKPVAQPVSLVRGAAVARRSRAPLIGAILLVALAAAGGVWWLRRPTAGVEKPPATTAPSASSIQPVSPALPATEPQELVAEELAPPIQPAQGETRSRKAVERRTPFPEEPAPAQVPPEPMKPGDLIRAGQPGAEPPEIQSLPAYSYPAGARGSGRRVSIRVAVLVDETGQVTQALIREGDSSGLGFNEAALEAARKARFHPGRRDGVDGKMWTELLLDFAE